MVDASSSKSTNRICVLRGLSTNAAFTAAATLHGMWRGVSGCSLIESSYVLPSVAEEPLSSTPDSRVEFCGTFIFSTVTPQQYVILAIPGLLPTVVLTSGPFAGVGIDTAHPAVAALVTELESGKWCNPWGHVLVKLESAYVQVRHGPNIPG